MVNCTLFIDNLLYVGYPNGKFVKVEGILQSVDELTKDGGSLVRKISKIPCNFTILGDFKNEIRYIGKIDDNNILISLINGELWKYDIGINIATKIFDFERTIWRALVINNSIIIAIGKYGFFVTLKYINSKWEVENNLNYTNNSMFCLDLIKENTFFVNDYRGNNYIKKIENDKLVSIEVTDSIGNIQHAYKISENSFATISLSSRIEVFDYENIELYKWNESSFNVISYKTLAYQSRVIFDLLEYPGKDIIASKNYILAMTNYEILFIDIMSLKTEILKFENQLHSLEKIGEYFIVVANDSRIWLLDPEKIIPISEIINYECKIGLIGTSNVGKSTLCHYLQNNELVNLDSSFGRKIWLLDNPRLKLKDKHYISLYDIAGQRGQVFTHFPNMKNNSHIFLVANQRIRETLDDIILNLPFIRQHVNKNCKFHLIITHADVKNDDTIGIDFDDIIKKYGINNYFRIGLKENYLDSVNQIFNLLTEITTQNHFQKIIISETTYKIRSYINSKFNSSIKDKKLELLSPEDISKNLELPMETVKYNLKRLDERGEIEFIEFANTIAINFKFYNKLKTEIPNYIRNQDGIVTYNTLINQFDEININYINYIIKSLQKNGFLYITDIHTFDRNKNNPKNIISHIVIPFHLKELDNVNMVSNDFNYHDNKEYFVDQFEWINLLSILEGENHLKIHTLYNNLAIFEGVNNDFAIEIYNQKDRSGKIKVEIKYCGNNKKLGDKILIDLESFFFNKNIIKEKNNSNNNTEIDTIDNNNEEISNCVKPRVYISYGQKDDDFINWIKKVANQLKSEANISVSLDQDLTPHDNLNEFMDSMYDHDIVLVFTNFYYNNRLRDKNSGVSYEMRKINRLIEDRQNEKIIVILCEGGHNDVPTMLRSLNHLDFRDLNNYDNNFHILAQSIWRNIPKTNIPPFCLKPSWIQE